MQKVKGLIKEIAKSTHNNLIAGKQKAVIGGATTGTLTLLGQLGVNGDLTIKQIVAAAVAWIVGHIFVYLTSNR